MTTLGQTLNILSGIAFLTAVTLWALGKLPLRTAYVAAIAANIVGFASAWIAGSLPGMVLRLIAVACFIAALAVHHATARHQEAEDTSR